MGQILQCLTVQGISSSSGGQLGSDSGSNSGLSRAMVKERFKTFNIQFEELHQRQSQWSVPDSELRESLRLAVAEVLLPAFRSFIRRFGYVFTFCWIFSTLGLIICVPLKLSPANLCGYWYDKGTWIRQNLKNVGYVYS